MKRLALWCALVAVGVAGAYAYKYSFNAVRPASHRALNVAIVSIVEIQPIADLRRGFRERLLESPVAKSNPPIIREYNAQGDAGVVNQLADKLAAEKPDCVYVLGTPVAQALQKRAPDILIVQGAVTDPVAAGLAASWDASGRRYVATSDLPPVETQLELIARLTPRLMRLGVIYNPAESNSTAVISRVRSALLETKSPIKLIERPISNSSEVATVLNSLIGRIDGLYLPPDNTAHSAIPIIGRFATSNDLPFFATVESALGDGAVATLSLDFVTLGREAADLLLRVLDGEDPASMPITATKTPSIHINAQRARVLSLDLAPLASLKRVVIVDQSATP